MPQVTTTFRPTSSGTLTIAGHRISFRVCLFWAGVSFWIADMFFSTGSAGVAALWASLTFLAEIVLITSATRTINLARVAKLYCLGGAMASVMWVIASVFSIFEPSVDAVSRQFFVPFMEESLKLAPVLFILWRCCDSRRWSVGASDVLLMAAASGAGFGLVEEAFIRIHLGTPHALDWLPITRVNGATLTVGHGIWTGLCGLTLGLALLWRPRRPLNYLLAGSGILWSILDHSHHNYGVDRRGLSVDLFNFITGHGWISLYFFLLGAIVVIGSDLYAVRGMLTSRPQLKLQGGKPPGIHGQGDGLKELWNFLVDRRALAYLVFRCQRSSSPTKEEMARAAAVLERRLLKRATTPVLTHNSSIVAAD